MNAEWVKLELPRDIRCPEHQKRRELGLLFRILADVGSSEYGWKHGCFSYFSLHYDDDNYTCGWYYKGPLELLARALKIFHRYERKVRFLKYKKSAEG